MGIIVLIIAAICAMILASKLEKFYYNIRNKK